MAMRLTKEECQKREAFYKEVFYQAAKQLSKETKQRLGHLAWKRHDAEYGPGAGLQNFLWAASFLEGYYRAFFLSLSRDEQNILDKIYHEVWAEKGL